MYGLKMTAELRKKILVGAGNAALDGKGQNRWLRKFALGKDEYPALLPRIVRLAGYDCFNLRASIRVKAPL
jgi:hypothetical protein